MILVMSKVDQTSKELSDKVLETQINHAIHNELAYSLQQKLVQCCIDFINDNRGSASEIERVVFTADMLQESANQGRWMACTDSTCHLEGFDDDKGFYEIGFSA